MKTNATARALHLSIMKNENRTDRAERYGHLRGITVGRKTCWTPSPIMIDIYTDPLASDIYDSAKEEVSK